MKAFLHSNADTLDDGLDIIEDDEVQVIGTELGLPDEIVWCQPFLGPGFVSCIAGDMTKERLGLLRKNDAVAREEMTKAGLDRYILQCKVVLLADVRTSGVQGDERTYDSPIVLYFVLPEDAMTADLVQSSLRCAVLTLFTEFANERLGIKRVVMDLASNSLSTIERE